MYKFSDLCKIRSVVERWSHSHDNLGSNSAHGRLPKSEESTYPIPTSKHKTCLIMRWNIDTSEPLVRFHTNQ